MRPQQRPCDDLMEVGPVAGPVDLAVTLPGSKSLSVRALLLAALANGTSRLSGVLPGADTVATVRVLRELGVVIETESTQERDVVTVHGVGGRWPATAGVLDVGESATLARMVTAILAAGAQEGDWVLVAGEGLRRRSLASLLSALHAAGGRIQPIGDRRHLPVRISGGGLTASKLTVLAAHTSQDVSAALLAAVASRRTMTVQVVSRQVELGYVRMTIAALASFGHDVRIAGPDEYEVRPAAVPTGRDLTIEPDVSTAAYPAALAALTGGRVRIFGYPILTSQPDARFLSVLSRMGCAVSREADALVVLGPTQLRGGFRVSMNGMADQAATMVALAMFADRPIEICDVARIRGHESDRLESLAAGLAAMGVACTPLGNGIRVVPGRPVPVTLDPRRDHRVAMAFALVGLAGDGMRIRDPHCVAKSYPGFFAMLRDAGVALQPLAADSPAAAGHP